MPPVASSFSALVEDDSDSKEDDQFPEANTTMESSASTSVPSPNSLLAQLALENMRNGRSNINYLQLQCPYQLRKRRDPRTKSLAGRREQKQRTRKTLMTWTTWLFSRHRSKNQRMLSLNVKNI
jgi:hypothetical protein